jgi:hypothetical protein
MPGSGNARIGRGDAIGDKARRLDFAGQAKRRGAMYDLIAKAEEADVGEIECRVAAKRASAQKQGDPLQLSVKGRGADKARRQRQARVEGLQRGRKTLQVLNARQMQAARIVRDMMQVMTGGLRAQDFTREKVDGGRLPGQINSSAAGILYADYSLRKWFAQAEFGALQIEIVMRIAGMEESITGVCLDFETDKVALGRSESTRETKAYVKRLFVEAMNDLADVIVPLPNQCAKPVSPMTSAIRSWSKDGANFSLKQTVFGERADLVVKRC